MSWLTSCLTADRPRIWQLAQTVRSFSDPEVTELFDDQPRWLTQGPPRWAAIMEDGADPADAVDAPPVQYFLRISSSRG